MLSFAFSVTGPIFILVFIGIGLKLTKLIDEGFMNMASKLVFMVSLPALLFMSVMSADIKTLLNPLLLGVSIGGTLIIFVLLSLSAKLLVKEKREQGVYIQGAFRSNLAIIGLAFCMNAYGQEGLAKASILMSVLTLLYNVLSIYTLSASLSKESTKFSAIAISIAKNPLMIAIVAGLIFNVANIPFHPVLTRSGEILAQMTLPLALVCIGGTISFAELKLSSQIASYATIAKLVVTPALLVYFAYLWGFEGIDLGVLFLLVSAPTAAASYVMVQAMGGNAKLAANIIVISTLGSLITVSLGLVILQGLNLV